MSNEIEPWKSRYRHAGFLSCCFSAPNPTSTLCWCGGGWGFRRPRFALPDGFLFGYAWRGRYREPGYEEEEGTRSLCAPGSWASPRTVRPLQQAVVVCSLQLSPTQRSQRYLRFMSSVAPAPSRPPPFLVWVSALPGRFSKSLVLVTVLFPLSPQTWGWHLLCADTISVSTLCFYPFLSFLRLFKFIRDLCINLSVLK